MKLFRTLNAGLDPSQPPIQWEGDVRGIIAARRAEEVARMSRLRLRLLHRESAKDICSRTQNVALEVAT